MIRLIIALAALAAFLPAHPCTSAIVGAGASSSGKTLLWKHRDSSHPDNVVARVAPSDSTLGYVALFNASDPRHREAWAGMNEAGFAVMNTAVYNLAPDTAALKDCEGLLMSRALASCRSVADFTSMLDSLAALPQPMGVQACFGAIDSGGGGVYVEASDHSTRVYPLAEAKEGFLVRTNFAFSGPMEGRKGEMRYGAARHLISDSIAAGSLISPEMLISSFSRSFYDVRSRSDLLAGGVISVPDTGDLIPRRSSCASVVFEIGEEGEPVMWVALGNPLGAELRRVTLNSVPPELLASPATGRSPLCDSANRVRDRVWHSRNRQGQWLIDLNAYRRLMNPAPRKSKTPRR